MLFSIKRVARKYVKGYFKFCDEYNLEYYSNTELYELLSYSIHRVFNLESSEYNWLIAKYGITCINYLKKIRRVSRNLSKIMLSDKLSICSLCKSYYIAICKLLDYEECELVESTLPF